MKSRIAIIGSGISGLGAAWALHREHDIVLFEADSRVGGHSNTVDVADADGVTSVDTGFIVYNEVTYPNLTRLFEALGVATQPSDMSFSFSLDREVEYGASLRGLTAQPSNFLRYRFRQMLRDIDRFRRIGPGLEPEATDHERELLRAIGYRPNVAVLHSDPNLMPSRRGVWSSWNAVATSDGGAAREVSVTYWMNRLQNLDGIPLFVSLNPNHPPHTDLAHAVFRYAHPQFDAAAIAAQSGIAAIQGENNTWFAGAYLGYGFHEDGLQSGLNVAAALGSPAPWHGTFPPVSSAPPVGAGRGAR